MGEDRRQVGHLPARARQLNGLLSDSARAELADRPLGLYVHVPFCASRCGYCAFNTYTAGELGGTRSQAGYADAAIAEIRLAAKLLGSARPPLRTVYFGGGTPTLLPARDLVRILEAARSVLGVASDVEVTVEANPDSVDAAMLAALVEGGFTRISFGMQSVRPHVLRVLERTHTAGRPEMAARQARAAGFQHVNLDLIFGAPGETGDDWMASLDAVVAAGPDHVSAYALTVEPRTRLAAQVRRGRVAAPDDDVLARRYEMADERLSSCGFAWYEVSNWARDIAARCSHNLLYWRNDHWWGIGPGAHSHVGDTRWWNVAHPAEYASLVQRGEVPAAGRETLTAEQRALEEVLLGIRLAEGWALTDDDLRAAARLVDDGLLDEAAFVGGRAVLTRPGRLLADHICREIVTQRGATGRCIASPGHA